MFLIETARIIKGPWLFQTISHLMVTVSETEFGTGKDFMLMPSVNFIRRTVAYIRIINQKGKKKIFCYFTASDPSSFVLSPFLPSLFLRASSSVTHPFSFTHTTT